MIQVKLDVRPVPSPRPLVTKFGARMPKKYMEHKKLIQAKIRGFRKFGNVPLRVELNLFFKAAKSAKRNKYPMVKGDVDNYAKTYLDAMEGVLYENDMLVEELVVTKKYSDVNAVFITVSEVVV